jgi:hypothetical protein
MTARPTVLTLNLFLTILGLAAQPLPEVDVRPYKGRPTVYINGVPDALPGFNTFGRQPFERSMTLAYPTGFSVYFITPQVAGEWPETRFWIGDRIESTPIVAGGKDLFDLDQQAEHILRGDPKAWIIVRYALFAPASWRRLHEDQYFIADDGSHGRAPSLASELYFRDASRFSAAIIRYCESRPWARRVIGYANFGALEGTHYPAAEGWLYDHNPLMTARWRDFLLRRYGSVASLRAAYSDPALTFESAGVPRDKLRGPAIEVANIPYWQNRKDNQPLRDYLELQRELFLASLTRFSRDMQAAAGRKVLFLHDALKQTMLGWTNFGFFNYPNGGKGYSWPFAYPEYMAASGSMNVTGMFGTPGFDGLITPHDYQARGIGGVYEPEGMADSAVLRGAYFYTEMDTRTWVNTRNEIGLARDVREYAANTWRNLATGWTRGFNSYWMEFGAGWFDPPEIREVIRQQVRAIRESIERPHAAVPGIAMILDDTAVLETNGAGNFFNEAILWEQKMGIARCGVPHNIYQFEDLELDNFPRHRVYYFPNLFRVDAKRLELLRRKVFRDGAVIVWGPGSGISDGERIGAESATRLTGFEFETIDANAPRRILISNFEHPITRGLAEDTVIGGPLAYGPVLMPLNGTPLGIAWAKGGFNHTGLAVREIGSGDARYTSVFVTAVNLPAALWRNLARHAGAHVWSESNDVLVANSTLVALHSIRSGPKRIALPGLYRVRDVVANAEYAPATREILFDLKAPETRVFALSPSAE